MSISDLVKQITIVLRNNNITKPVSIPKHVFHISDDDGNKKNFYVKKADANVLYTTKDVNLIIHAMLDVIYDAVKRGEEVKIHGFGNIGLRYRHPKVVRNVYDGQLLETKGYYAPKFVCGNDLRRCGHIYEQSLRDGALNALPLPDYTEDE